jgi:hypothetical protein
VYGALSSWRAKRRRLSGLIKSDFENASGLIKSDFENASKSDFIRPDFENAKFSDYQA